MQQVLLPFTFALTGVMARGSPPQFYKPADTAPHTGTIMGWPTPYSIFGDGGGWTYPGVDLAETRQEIANIALAIAKYEPVQMLVRDPKTIRDPRDLDNLRSAKELLGKNENITLVVTPDADSLWMRDTGPLLVETVDGSQLKNTWPSHADAGVGLKPVDTSSRVVGLQLGFNQWGRKLPPSPDSK